MTILNREQIDADGLPWSTEDVKATMRAYHDLRDAVLALCLSSDDGSEYEHVPGCAGEDTCPACWAESIRACVARVDGGPGDAPIAAREPREIRACPECGCPVVDLMRHLSTGHQRGW